MISQSLNVLDVLIHIFFFFISFIYTGKYNLAVIAIFRCYPVDIIVIISQVIDCQPGFT